MIIYNMPPTRADMNADHPGHCSPPHTLSEGLREHAGEKEQLNRDAKPASGFGRSAASFCRPEAGRRGGIAAWPILPRHKALNL